MPEISRTVDSYDRRFGVVAIKSGYITQEDLVSALGVQVKEVVENRSHRLIGQILLDEGSMSADQIERVLKTIFQE